MDFFGYIITFCLVISIFISNFIFVKNLKGSNLKLKKTKILYFFISILSVLIAISLVIISIGFIEDYLFPEINDFNRTLLYRAILLLFVIFIYYIFQYVLNKLFLKKIIKKSKIEAYTEIGKPIDY